MIHSFPSLSHQNWESERQTAETILSPHSLMSGENELTSIKKRKLAETKITEAFESRILLPPEKISILKNETFDHEAVSETNYFDDFNEFKQLIMKIGNESKHLTEKMEALKRGLTPIKNETNSPKEWHQCWIDINAHSFMLILLENSYESNTLKESELLSKDQKESSSLYYYFKLYAEADEEHKAPLLVLRASKDGKSGEIIHIQSCKTVISGNALKESVAALLCDFIAVDHLYLNDRAKYDFVLSQETSILRKRKNNKTPQSLVRSLKIRKYRPIGEKYGLTWYKDFTSLSGDWTGYEGTRCSQDQALYKAAIEKVRNTTLFLFHERILKNYPEHQNKLRELCEDYLSEKKSVQPLKKDSRLNQLTIHDLVHAVLDKSRKNFSLKTNQDFVYIYKNFLNYYQLKGRQTKELVQYNLALEVIRLTQLWVKRKNPLCPSS